MFGGTSQSRVESSVACKLIANLNGKTSGIFSSSSIIPTVDTNTLRLPNLNPLSSLRIYTAFNTCAALSSGSPMPMKTTRSYDGKLLASRASLVPISTYSTIYAVDKLPVLPPRPVKQNWQFIAQPT